MYIVLNDGLSLNQDVLYCRLQDSFNMENKNVGSSKLAGIYAIYKDELCLYVGQSKNLASRLATHLKGKYSTATTVFFWNIETISSIQITDDNMQNILLKYEKFFMSKLKPIENILIDMDFSLSIDEDSLIEYNYNLINDNEVEYGIYADKIIRIHKKTLFIMLDYASRVIHLNGFPNSRIRWGKTKEISDLKDIERNKLTAFFNK